MNHICNTVPVKALLFSLLFLTGTLELRAQGSVKGPTCVVADQTYHYQIADVWASDSTVQVCVTGGKLMPGAVACMAAGPQTPIRIAWNKGTSAGRIQVTAKGQTFSLECTTTSFLQGGVIPSAAAQQLVDSAASPAPLNCSPATGGDCLAAYVYQWEQSDDRINWQPITGATGAVFQFSSPVNSARFFRRKVTDSLSHSEAYSNTAAIFIKENNDNQ